MFNVKVSVESNRKQYEAAAADAIQRGLEGVGMEAVDKAQGGTPVDTGRLRNSIAWAVGNNSGGGDDTPMGAAPVGTVVIGSNVEYAEIIEEGGQGRKAYRMLRNAISDISSSGRAKAIIEASLEAATD